METKNWRDGFLVGESQFAKNDGATILLLADLINRNAPCVAEIVKAGDELPDITNTKVEIREGKVFAGNTPTTEADFLAAGGV